MYRSFVTFVVVSLAVVFSSESSLVSEGEMVGVWKVDPSTFRARELATPSLFPRPQLPTNFVAFELWLRKDGLFVASNVPTAFFFESSPFTNVCAGKWQIETNWPLLQTAHRNENGTTNWVIVRDLTNGYSELNLLFHSPSNQWSWAWRIDRVGRATPSYYTGAEPRKDKTGTYEWIVAIRKQNLNDAK